MYFIYAIYNKENRKVYIGQTIDISKRLVEHNNKNCLNHKYTSKFQGEWKLIYSEATETRQKALHREKQLKSFRGREFIKKHIPL